MRFNTNTLEKLTQRWNSYRHRKSLSIRELTKPQFNRCFSFGIRFNYMRFFGHFLLSAEIVFKNKLLHSLQAALNVYLAVCLYWSDDNDAAAIKVWVNNSINIEMMNKWLAEKWNARTNKMNNNHTMENGQQLLRSMHTCKWLDEARAF